ncbi:hypothetical protein NUM3379_23930 [Kineococcus sp. NUM-3379]
MVTAPVPTVVVTAPVPTVAVTAPATTARQRTVSASVLLLAGAAAAVRAMVPVEAVPCGRSVWSFRYGGDMRRA